MILRYKSIIAIIILILTLIPIKLTLSFLSDAGVSVNTFEFGVVETEIREDINEIAIENIGVDIKSNTPTYIRFKLNIPNIVDIKTGNMISPEVIESDDLSNWNYWNGYYYYNDTVDKNSNTLKLYDKIYYNLSAIENIDEIDIQNLGVVIYTESIQANNLDKSITNSREAFEFMSNLKD